MTSKEVRERLNTSFNIVSVRHGIYTAKKSYYWGVTKSGEAYADKVRELIPNAEIIEFGNHFAPFRGGARAGGPQDSYYWVKFKVN